MQNYLPACKIVSTHGVRGEMKALPLCDGAAFLAKFKRLFTSADGAGETRVLGVRAQGNVILLRLDGAPPDDVLRRANGFYTYFAADIAYHYNKLATRGFAKAIDVWGADHHGQLTNVDRPAAQDIYTVTDGAGEEYMLPAVPEFVKKIDIDSRKIFVTPIEGMFTDAVNGDED